MFEKRLREIEARKLEIRGILQDETQTPDYDKLKGELETLDTEKRGLETRAQIMAGISQGTTQTRNLDIPDSTTKKVTAEEARATKEYRNAYMKILMRKGTTQEEHAIWEKANELRFDTTQQGVIPTITLDLVKQKLLITSAIYPLVDKYAVKGNLKVPREDATADPAWHVEAAPIVPAADSVDYVQLAGFELVKIVTVSRAMEDMSIEAFESYIVDKLAKKIQTTIENAILNGAGTTEPTGIMNAFPWNAGNKVTYTSFAKMDYQVFTKIKALLLAPYHANARFVMNNKTLWTGVANVLDALGRPIFMINPQLNLANDGNNNYIVNQEVGKLLGTPVVMTPYAADGDVILGDLSYYVFNMARDILIEKSYESSFRSNMVDYKASLTGDGNVILAEAFVKASFV